MNASRTFRFFALAILCTGLAASAQAQSYPSKPVRFIVPVAAGSGFDVAARLIGERLAKKFGQPVVVENQPGAGTTLGVASVARAAPDGYTIGILLSPVTIQHTLMGAQMPFDARKDLAPVILYGWDFNILVLNPAVPVSSLKDFIAHLKANPGKLNYASGGNGTPAHIAAEFFKQSTGSDMTHVPYKGADFAVQDLLAGRVQVMFGNVPATLPHIRAGKLRALAVVGKKRLEVAPDLPSMAELGYPNIDVPNWTGVVAPAGTPQPVIAVLNREIAAALADPEVAQRIGRANTVIDIMGPDAMRKQIADDIQRWADVIAKAGIKGGG
jgi:tripartite-type tricarboxylate transporter receptor subunit TctC